MERSDYKSNSEQLGKSIDQTPASGSQAGSETEDSQQGGSSEGLSERTEINNDSCPLPTHVAETQGSQRSAEPAHKESDLKYDSPPRKKVGAKGSKSAGTGAKKATKTAGDLFQAPRESEKIPEQEA